MRPVTEMLLVKSQASVYVVRMTEMLGATELLTTREISRRLGVCRETVCLAIRSGHLQAAMKLPGRNGAYLVAESAVVEWRCPGDRLLGL